MASISGEKIFVGKNVAVLKLSNWQRYYENTVRVALRRSGASSDDMLIWDLVHWESHYIYVRFIGLNPDTSYVANFGCQYEDEGPDEEIITEWDWIGSTRFTTKSENDPPEPFYWTSEIESDLIFNISASEWNNFKTTLREEVTYVRIFTFVY